MSSLKVFVAVVIWWLSSILKGKGPDCVSTDECLNSIYCNFFQAYIRKQILQIENDPTLDDIEKARRKQVFISFRSCCHNHVFFLFRLVKDHVCPVRSSISNAKMTAFSC